MRDSINELVLMVSSIDMILSLSRADLELRVARRVPEMRYHGRTCRSIKTSWQICGILAVFEKVIYFQVYTGICDRTLPDPTTSWPMV